MKRTILRIPAVKSESGLSRSTIYLRISERLWTKPVALGPRAVGWPSDEVAALIAARIAGRTDEHSPFGRSSGKPLYVRACLILIPIALEIPLSNLARRFARPQSSSRRGARTWDMRKS
jgi:prophage regulatory protein